MKNRDCLDTLQYFFSLTLAFLTFYNFSPETVFFTNDAAQTFAVASLAFKEANIAGPTCLSGEGTLDLPTIGIKIL